MAGHPGDHELEMAGNIGLARRHSSQYLSTSEDGEIKVSTTPKMSGLHQAASGNQEKQLAYLMSLKNNDVNKRDELERTPLIVAARKGHERSVQILLESPNIDVNATAKGGFTALHVASFCGHANVVQQLLSYCRNVKSSSLELLKAQVSQELFTALHMAACSNNGAVVRIIWEAYELANLSQSVIIEAVNGKDCIGWTPLHYAAWQGNTRVLIELLSLEPVNVNASDGDGFTALHLASWRGHREVVHLLLDHCDAERASDVEPNKEVRSNLSTLAYLSTLQKDVDWESLPRPRLADYRIREQRSKVTALHYAVEQNQEEIVIELLENPNTDVHLENSERNSAFDIATSEKNSRLLWVLLGNYREKFEHWERLQSALSKRGYKNIMSRGHNSQEKKLNNCGELLKAALVRAKYDDVIFLLKELEMEMTEMNEKIKLTLKSEVSILHHAAFAGLEKLVEILAGIPSSEINIEDSDDQTPLHYAAVAGRANVVRVLIAKGCRANAEDKFGRTALQVAVESGKHDVEKLLLERPDVRDYVDRYYRNRQVFVDAANTMLLGAALIASVTFAGWLQPPAGFTPYYQLEVPGVPNTYESYASVDMHLSMRVFWVFNSLSFFCSIATVIAGAGAVLPTLDVFIGQEVKFVKRTLVATSTLLVFSVVFILGAFGAAGYASLPPIPKYESSMTYTVIPGVFLCMASMLWFLKRLYGIRPTWWRKCEVVIRPRQRLHEKVRSARELFSKPRQDQ